MHFSLYPDPQKQLCSFKCFLVSACSQAGLPYKILLYFVPCHAVSAFESMWKSIVEQENSRTAASEWFHVKLHPVRAAHL